MQVSVFGIGKVGITLIASLLKAGFKVTGVDTDKHLVDRMNTDQITFGEPGVQALIDANRARLTVTLDAGYAVSCSDLSFIIVPTHTNESGGFSNRYILDAVRSIGKHLANKPGFHTLVVVSTVMPGSSINDIIPVLEQASGKTAGIDIGFCYNPLFIAQGEILKGIVTPDYILIGEHCKKSGNLLESIQKKLLGNNAPIVRMNPTEAEITKLASNTHETMRVSFSNMLAQTCNEMPGTNVDNVTNALSFRLGKRFFKGATPYGGPCWPRDNIALSSLLNSIGLKPLIPEAVHRFNQYHSQYLIEKLQHLVNSGKRTIGLIGVAYKVGTPLIEESFALEIVNRLTGEGLEFVIFDPLASDVFQSHYRHTGKQVRTANEADECLKQSICLLLQPLPVIGKLSFEKYQDTTVIDYWRMVPKNTSDHLPNYLAFGVNHQKEFDAPFLDTLKSLTS
ncbi:MAG: hypothetical protein CSB48_10310 [Proteobacteria bacterium]|nr:MAG: hypothetical protein CSB48_10310 [Pseudomonadota bacterium]